MGNVILVSGSSSTGKSYSLRNLENPEGVMYLTFEAGKVPPFDYDFNLIKITNPKSIFKALDQLASDDNYHTMVVDTMTFMMDMYVSRFVLTSSNVMSAWGEYAEFWKKIMQKYVAASDKNIIFLGHTTQVYDNETLGNEFKVVVPGKNLMSKGIESWFNTVVSTKLVDTDTLKDYENEYLHVTDDDRILGYKHVYQTRLTRDTLNEKMRGPGNLWTIPETFIDNDIQIVMNKLNKYYK